MVKSKKMSKGSLAIIILAVLLVLSMVLGLTGAWFTDKASGKDETNNGTFGRNQRYRFCKEAAPL